MDKEMKYLERSNELFETSDKYRSLLNNINDNIKKQFVYSESENYNTASDIGLQVWSDLKKLITLLGAKCLYDIEYETSYDLLYWATELASTLNCASKKYDSYFLKLKAFCKEYVEMHKNFCDNDVRNLGNIRSELAEYYCRLGDFDHCDQLYEEWLTQEPEWGWGWIRWSDCYWLFYNREAPLFSKAESILKKGLSIKNVEAHDELQQRMKSLHEEQTERSLS